MYNLFCSKYTDVTVSYYYYRQFFHENFNLHFGRPQVDTCTKCEELTLKIKGTQQRRHAEKMVHERCKQRNDLGVICFDYIQNLQLPLIPVQDVFYLTQFTVSLFCIHDMRSDKSYFYIYPENAAAKSPNEVCSFLAHFLENYMSVSRNCVCFRIIVRARTKITVLYDFVQLWWKMDALGRLNKFFPSAVIHFYHVKETLLLSNEI
nr:unnamed protein product [Callosobruchus analis]